MVGKRSKHIVLVPLATQGHLPPMIYLAKKLAVEEFIVTIINIDSIHEVLQKNWKHVPEQDILLTSIPMELKLPEGFSHSSNEILAAFLDAIEGLEEPLAQLFTQLNTERGLVSCVISDYYHTSAPLAASKAGIPSVCLWPGAATWASIQYNLPLLRSRGLLPVEESKAGEVITFIPGLQSIKAADLPVYLHRGSTYSHRTAADTDKLYSRYIRRVPLDSWVLANSVYELEPGVFDALQQVVAPSKLISIGPLFPLKAHNSREVISLRQEDQSVLEWLDKQAQSSVLYVAFGSTAVLTFAEIQEIAKALEASGRLFIWVLRSNQVPDMPDNFVDDFVGRTGRSGLVVTWAPQLAVLHHNSVGGFLSHCGWNSVFESISAGVPMLGWPCFCEQNTNVKLIVEGRGLGVQVEKSSGALEKAIKSLMSPSEAGEKMRLNTGQARDIVTAAAAQGGSSYNNLQAFFAAFS